MMNLLQNFTEVANLNQLEELDLDNLSHLHCHLHWKDKNGKYLNCNNRMLADIGLNNRNDLFGLTDFDFSFLTEQEASAFRMHDHEVIAKEITEFYLEPCTLFDSRKVIALSQKSPLRLRSKKIIGTVSLSFIVNKDETSISTVLPDNASESKPDLLTRRQADCLYYLVNGMTMKQIASILNLSPKTVEHYIETVKMKLNCHSRAELIIKALQVPSIKERLKNCRML